MLHTIEVFVVAFLFSFGIGYLVYRLVAGAIRRRHVELDRAAGNPIVTPGEHAWEAGGTFNPTAVKSGGDTHLFYRAVGQDGVSRIGYARSRDGVTVDERLPFPVFALGRPFAPVVRDARPPRHPGLLASGGSWAGAEDPRAIGLDGRLYLSFSAFSGWDSVRIGVASLGLDELADRRWKWSAPVFLSAPNEVSKNWVIFPERIGGKIAVLHSLHSGSRDRVLVDYLESLDEQPATFIRSKFAPISDSGRWDSTLRGAAAPPIRTPRGWLLLYHATSANEPHRYKLGAMLLDLKDPSKVTGRSPAPILAPDAHYENSGAKAGVVYACGAVAEGDTLRVYYGASDSWSCVAETSLSALLGSMS